jgi:hypothetical protein
MVATTYDGWPVTVPQWKLTDVGYFFTGVPEVARRRDATQGSGMLLKQNSSKVRTQTPNTGACVYNNTDLHPLTSFRPFYDLL